MGLRAYNNINQKIVCDVLGVTKDVIKQQSLIIDARSTNKVIIEPAQVELPNTAHLVSLVCPKESEFFLATSDMENFYHRLRMPCEVRQYFRIFRNPSPKSRRYYENYVGCTVVVADGLVSFDGDCFINKWKYLSSDRVFP